MIMEIIATMKMIPMLKITEVYWAHTTTMIEIISTRQAKSHFRETNFRLSKYLSVLDITFVTLNLNVLES